MISINLEDFLHHLQAPFRGAHYDHDGNVLPSGRKQGWTFSLGNSRLKNHLTFRSTRLKGEFITQPILVEVMNGCNNQVDYIPLGWVGGDGAFEEEMFCSLERRADIGKKTLLWLLRVAKENYEMPDHLEILALEKCARCSLPLTNPDSLKRAIGPICAHKMNLSKPAE